MIYQLIKITLIYFSKVTITLISKNLNNQTPITSLIVSNNRKPTIHSILNKYLINQRHHHLILIIT